MKWHLRSSRAILDVVFTSLRLAPRNHDDVLPIQCRDDVFPLGDGLDVFPVRLLRSGEQIRLDGLEEAGDSGGNVVERNRVLGACVAADGQCLFLCEIIRSDFEAKRDTLDTPSA